MNTLTWNKPRTVNGRRFDTTTLILRNGTKVDFEIFLMSDSEGNPFFHAKANHKALTGKDFSHHSLSQLHKMLRTEAASLVEQSTNPTGIAAEVFRLKVSQSDDETHLTIATSTRPVLQLGKEGDTVRLFGPKGFETVREEGRDLNRDIINGYKAGNTGETVQRVFDDTHRQDLKSFQQTLMRFGLLLSERLAPGQDSIPNPEEMSEIFARAAKDSKQAD